MPNHPIIPPNRIKRALRNGQAVIGTMIVEFRQPSVVQLLANAGFDFFIIDNEHGPFTIETIADLTRAAVYMGLTPLVRVPELTYAYIAQSLDAGAQGIMAPRISTAAQVRDVVQMMKYPPVGLRGNALSRGYTQFKSGPVAEVMTQVNEETLLIVQVEMREAVENIDEIVSTPGVDVALIGPNDLSIALGVPGQQNHPTVQAAIQKTMAACQRHGVAPGIHMNDLSLAVHWAKQGMRLVSSNAEIGLLVRAGQEVTKAIGEAMGR
jgi:2-dehydro-3-deoxyglucarate aldolase/4-hydroxy-2-oxoheptanedioate aldolase